MPTFPEYSGGQSPPYNSDRRLRGYVIFREVSQPYLQGSFGQSGKNELTLPAVPLFCRPVRISYFSRNPCTRAPHPRLLARKETLYVVCI